MFSSILKDFNYFTISNFIWFYPPKDGNFLDFLYYFSLFFIPFTAIFFLGLLLPKLRKYFFIPLFLLPSVLGLIFPMINHGGDDSYEMIKFISERNWGYKVGEALGTLPFSLLGRLFNNPPISPEVLARCLAIFAIIGGLSLAAHVIRTNGPKQSKGYSNFLSANEFWFFSGIAASFPIVFFFSGFIQTTYVSAVFGVCFLPWIIKTVFRSDKSSEIKLWQFYLISFLGMILYFMHGIAIVIVIFIYFVLITEALSAAFNKNMIRVLGVCSAIVFLALGGIVLNQLLICFDNLFGWRLYIDAWMETKPTLIDSVRGVQELCHVFPKWVPFLGERQITLGQQTLFFSLPWFFFSLAAALHILNPILLYLAFARCFEKGKKDRNFLFFVFACLLTLGFIFLYSPHYSYPMDLDVVLLLGFFISYASLYLIWISTECDRYSAQSCQKNNRVFLFLLAALFYNILITAGIWALQYTYITKLVGRGISAGLP